MIQIVRRSLALVFLLGAGACVPQTGLIFAVQGPDGLASTDVGIAELELITAHRSYCERWVGDSIATGFRFSVEGRDLETSPATILLEPDERTDLADPVRATVLARDAAGQLLGVAQFDALRFTYEKVHQHQERIALLGRGARADGPRYVTDDGCMCLPGRSWVGNSTGQGCDLRVPPSFDRLVDTAGCELPPGVVDLPIGVCDGQLYPGEVENREIPCYASRGTTCRIGSRRCTDQNGHAYDRECSAQDTSPALPTGTLCDAFLSCEREACADPMDCLKRSVPNHKQVSCILPVAPVASADGVAQPCAGGSWSVSDGAFAATTCAAAMLDGIQQGAAKLGWQRAGETTASVSSSLCPPTFLVEKIDVSDPATLPETLSFTIALDDQLYDVVVQIKRECSDDPNAEANDLRCQLN